MLPAHGSSGGSVQRRAASCGRAGRSVWIRSAARAREKAQQMLKAGSMPVVFAIRCWRSLSVSQKRMERSLRKKNSTMFCKQSGATS